MLTAFTPNERRVALGGGAAAIAFIGLAIAIPVAALLIRGANENATELVFDDYLWRITRFTLYQAFLSTLLSVLLAIPLARAIARHPDFSGRKWILRLYVVPLGLPQLVAALGLLTIWGRQGVINSGLSELGMSEPFSIYGLSGILLAHVFFNLPLAARLLLMGLERLPQEYWKNAAIMGLSSWTTFRLIEWPAMVRPAARAAGLIFMLCVTSFTLVLVLGGGPAATTLEVAVYQALRFDFDPSRAVFLALIQISLTIAALSILGLFGGRDERSELLATGTNRPDVASGWRSLPDWVTIVLATLFVVSPILATIISGLSADLGRLASDPVFWRATVTSLAIAIVAACLAIILALLLIRARLGKGTSHISASEALLRQTAGASGSLVLLVPPVVLGAGWFLLFSGARGSLALPLTIIILINAMMALPFVMRVLESAYRTTMYRNGLLALSLGITGWNRIRRVDLPALVRPLSAAFAFAMALSLGDLGAIALFGNENLTTLPFLLLQKMGSYRTTDAAGLALLLTILCVGLMTFADRSTAAGKEGR